MAEGAPSGGLRFWQALAVLGPGLAIAATGVGARIEALDGHAQIHTELLRRDRG